MICSKCGATIPDGSTFCTACGAAVEQAAPAAAPAPQPVYAAQPAAGVKTVTPTSVLVWGILGLAFSELGLLGLIFSLIGRIYDICVEEAVEYTDNNDLHKEPAVQHFGFQLRHLTCYVEHDAAQHQSKTARKLQYKNHSFDDRVGNLAAQFYCIKQMI